MRVEIRVPQVIVCPKLVEEPYKLDADEELEIFRN
jgi:hypothetical protein